VAEDEEAETLTVRAVSTVDTSKSGTAAVRVYANQSEVPTVSGVTVSPAAPSVVKGGTLTFTAEVQGTNNPPQTVTWSVVGGGEGTSISASGVLTAAEDEEAETLTVRAVSTVDTSKSGTADVAVIPPLLILTLAYPADQAAEELSGLTPITPDTPITLTANALFDSYQWQADGFIKGTANTFTLNAGDYSPGIHHLTLEVTLNGVVYSKSGAFTVQK
jgi:hypothetical protein